MDWIVRHDAKGKIKFASLQGETAAHMVPEGAASLDSMVLVDGERKFRESDAVLRTGRLIGGFYGFLAGIASIFPRPFRNAVYRWVARNRYRWFGKKDTCRLPTPAERARFLP